MVTASTSPRGWRGWPSQEGFASPEPSTTKLRTSCQFLAFIKGNKRSRTLRSRCGSTDYKLKSHQVLKSQVHPRSCNVQCLTFNEFGGAERSRLGSAYCFSPLHWG